MESQSKKKRKFKPNPDHKLMDIRYVKYCVIVSMPIVQNRPIASGFYAAFTFLAAKHIQICWG